MSLIHGLFSIRPKKSPFLRYPLFVWSTISVQRFLFSPLGRGIPTSVKYKYPGSLECHLYGLARLTRFVFSSVSTVPYSRKKLQKPTFSPLVNFSVRICTKSLLFEYSIAKNEMTLLQHLDMMESLLCSSSTWFAYPLVTSLLSCFLQLADRLSSPDFHVAKSRNNTKQKDRQRQKQKKRVGHPSPEFPQKKKTIPVHPLFKAVAPPFSTRIKLLVFFIS